MGRLITYSILFLFCSAQMKSQNNELNMVFGTGINYIFADKITDHRPGGGMFTGLNFLMNKHNRGILFNPGIYIATDIYNTRLSDNMTAKLWSRSFGINLDVLLKLTKKCFLRIGINYCKIHEYLPEIVFKNGSQTLVAVSSDELYKDLDPYVYQAKITAGICIPVKFHSSQSKSRAKLNFFVIQNAIPLLNGNYNLPTYKGNERKVLWSSRSYPTNLFISLDVNLIGKRDKNKNTEAE